MATGETTKNGTLATTFHKPAGEENLFVRFQYVPQKICNHIQGKISGSINADLVNVKYRSIIHDENMITKTPKNNT